jgi:nitrogen regulatory protein P-II 1
LWWDLGASDLDIWALGVTMKLVTAIIRPERLEAVKEALHQVGARGLTVSEVRGFGVQGGRTEVYRGSEYRADLTPKVEVRVAVSEDDLGRIVGAILQTARTGSEGDGKIWITAMEHVIRIRTGEEDADAV